TGSRDPLKGAGPLVIGPRLDDQVRIRGHAIGETSVAGEATPHPLTRTTRRWCQRGMQGMMNRTTLPRVRHGGGIRRHVWPAVHAHSLGRTFWNLHSARRAVSTVTRVPGTR
ncbi:MAG: hypothetical protein EBU40_16195, partial [Proteobacteria bacterium]|nr:hypothetical protein [Pseudomonadota bacterium]